ncbi:MAG: chromosomal replication initiator protein DnaA [Pseudomonadota bacterium]|nr:chromosomal replication initiator protein DnaA [Pseudomonadota bacterium]
MSDKIPSIESYTTAWQECLESISEKLGNNDDFHQLIAPLQMIEKPDKITIYAPNQFIFDRVKERYLSVIENSIRMHKSDYEGMRISFAMGHPTDKKPPTPSGHDSPNGASQTSPSSNPFPLNPKFSFDQFITGRSNEFAFAAAQQAAANPGTAYNPFVIFGSTGLGKTHLMQSIGHAVLKKDPSKKILYLHAEKFLSEMIKSLRHGTMDSFKSILSEADVLMLDDIQFFANKERSQEELFHRFNEKLEDNKQVILTSDRYPKELDGFEDRLKSRFTWGLCVGVDPPELETRVAILIQKALLFGFDLAEDVAFFIADKIQTNVRELEGILKRLVAHSKFSGEPINLEFTKNALKDLLTIHTRQVSIDRIQQAISRYYKVKTSDLTGKRRLQSITRPRQLAMYIAKSLTSKSLPEIGRAFGGRDHTTVLHACKKISVLLETDTDLKIDYENLVSLLSN